MPHVGVLIDPHSKTVTEVLVGDDSTSIAPLLDCEWFDEVMLLRPLPHSPGAALYVDDVGLAREGQRFWSFRNDLSRIYGGKGIVLAVDYEGNTAYGVAPANLIAEHVIWRNVRFLGNRQETAESDGMFEIRVIPQFEGLDDGEAA